MVNIIGSYIQQFNNLPNDTYRARVVAKSLVVSAVVSYAVHYFAGSTCKKIAFLVTAPIIASGILDRISKTTFVFKDLKQQGSNCWETLKNNGNDFLKGFVRFCEDDSISQSRLNAQAKKEVKQKIAVQRTLQDVSIALNRVFKSLFEEIKYTMSL